MRIDWRRLALIAAIGLTACASASRSSKPDTYLKWVTFEALGHENILLRWHEKQMPLRVHLPRPPDGIFERPDEILESVRDGVIDWTDAASPGVPSFVFVDDDGDADIPIVWEKEPVGTEYIAHCVYDLDLRRRRFGVTRILVTGHWGGHVADLHDLYATVLHEMGHGLGLGGHSPDPNDIMFPSVVSRAQEGLSERDRATLRALYERPIGQRVTGARRSD